MPEIKVGSVWKHRYVNDNLKGPTQGPNMFHVTEVLEDRISVVQGDNDPERPTYWATTDFLDIFEPL